MCLRMLLRLLIAVRLLAGSRTVDDGIPHYKEPLLNSKAPLIPQLHSGAPNAGSMPPASIGSAGVSQPSRKHDIKPRHGCSLLIGLDFAVLPAEEFDGDRSGEEGTCTQKYGSPAHEVRVQLASNTRS